MDMSNKSMALLLVAVIVISLGGTIISLNKLNQVGMKGNEGTGMATYPGQVNVSITSSAACKIDTNVSFGSAAQVATATTISSNTDNTAAGYFDCTSGTNDDCEGMEINNTGNVDLMVNVTLATASTFLGGASVASTDFVWHALNGTYAGLQQGCQGTLNATWNTAAAAYGMVCTNLTAAEANDIVTIDYNITLRPDTPAGTKTATITVSCVAA